MRATSRTLTRLHCNALQHTATHCNTLQHTATHCNTLQHTATHCNTLQHTATHCIIPHHTATYCITLNHTESRCNILQPPPIQHVSYRVRVRTRERRSKFASKYRARVRYARVCTVRMHDKVSERARAHACALCVYTYVTYTHIQRQPVHCIIPRKTVMLRLEQ